MGNPDFNMIQGALMSGTIAGVETLGKAADLDPDVTRLAAMAAGTVVGNFVAPTGQQLSYEELMESIAPNIVSEAAYIGVTEVGEMLGINPQISYLAGIGIRSSLQVGFSTGGGDPGRIWDGVVNGLLRGATNVGLEWAAQGLDLDPLLASLGVRAVSGGIEGLLDSTGVFSGLFNAYKDSALNTLTLGGTLEKPIKPDSNSIYFLDHPDEYQTALHNYNRRLGEYYWGQAVYTAKVLDFSNEIQDKGLVGALETYATAVFQQDTIASIWKLGGIYDMVVSNAEIVDIDGTKVKRIYQDRDHANYIDISLVDNSMMAKMENGKLLKGEFKVHPETGQFGLWNGTIEYLDENSEYITETISNGNLVDIVVSNYSKEGQYKISAIDNERGISFTDEGKPQDSVVTNLKTGEQIVFEEGKNPKIMVVGELKDDGSVRNLSYDEQKIRAEKNEDIPELTYEVDAPWATWVTTIKIGTAETARDLWNVISLGTLDKVEYIIQDNPNASTGELVARALWAGLTSITNLLTLGYQDAIYYTQVEEGPGVDSILKGFLTHTYSLTPIGDFKVAIDGNKPIADRLEGLFMGISKTASWAAMGLAVKSKMSVSKQFTTEQIIKGDNFIIKGYTGPLKPYPKEQSLIQLMKNPRYRTFIQDTMRHHNDVQVIGGRRGFDWSYHDFEGPFGKNNPIVTDGLYEFKPKQFALDIHRKSAHHYNWIKLKMANPESAADIVNAWRQNRPTYNKPSWSFNRILRTINEDVKTGKITSAQKQALLEAMRYQQQFEEQGLITNYGPGVD